MSRRTVGVALAVAAIVAMSGCGVVQDAIGDRVDEAIGNAVEGGLGQIVEGVEDLGLGLGSEVPSSFPSELPLPEGSLTLGLAVDGGWLLAYQVADREAGSDLADRLQAQGYQLTASDSARGADYWELEGGGYLISVGVVGSDDAVLMMQYSVKPAE